MDQVESDKPLANQDRRITKVLTPGTLTESILLKDYQSNYLLAITEEQDSPSFGICLVECSIAQFTIGAIYDDSARSQLETLLIQKKPKEVVYVQGHVQKRTLAMIKRHSAAMLTKLAPDEVWEREKVSAELRSGCGAWLQASLDNPLTCMCIGIAYAYLHRLQLLDSLVSQNNIQRLDFSHDQEMMFLDGRALVHLEVLYNAHNGEQEGTLWQLFSHCATHFGMRLLRVWLCHPLYLQDDINARLDAVQEMMEKSDIHEDAVQVMKSLPDMERLLSRIHATAITLDAFLSFVEGLEKVWDIVTSLFCSVDDGEPAYSSSLLLKLTTVSDTSDFPNLFDIVSEFNGAIDKYESRHCNCIIPRSGFNDKYDAAVAEKQKVEAMLQSYLNEQKRSTGISMSYISNSKGRYLLEVPRDAKNRLPPNFIVKDTLKKVLRCQTERVVELVMQMEEAEQAVSLITDGLLLQCVNRMDCYFPILRKAVTCIAKYDALTAIAHVSRGSGYSMCRPEFVQSKETVLEIEDMHHPFLRPGGDATDVIPNSLSLGGEAPSALVLTGPNMGGKSTLLRQACLAVIMAQVGCFVPASRCVLSPVDRIFTRIGANDDILEGRSTFMVELQETASVLQHATSSSLVILDELGRGTSTFDGMAIAHAVLSRLVFLKCTLLFATHYHLLVSSWAASPDVAMYHMDCIVDSESDPPEVTFLYKAAAGICPKSYGMNVARMSGIPIQVIRRASEKSQQFEHDTTFTCPSMTHTAHILSSLTSSYAGLFAEWEHIQKQR